MTTLPNLREWCAATVAAADAAAVRDGFPDARTRVNADVASGAALDAVAIDTFLRSSGEYVDSEEESRQVRRWLITRGLLIEQRCIPSGGAHTPLHRALASSEGPLGFVGRVIAFIRVPVLTPRFVWKVKNHCNGRHNEKWYWSASKGVEFEGEPGDTFVWRLHRYSSITPEMEQPSVVGSSVADGIRSHMQGSGTGMWVLYDNRDRAVMNGCSNFGWTSMCSGVWAGAGGGITPNIHSTLCTDLSVIQ